MSKSRVYQAQGKLGQEYFLKVSSSAYVAQEIQQETQVLKWLSEQNISVPRALVLTRLNSEIYFLMTAIPGQSLAEQARELGPEKCMRLASQFLRRLHSLPISSCPFDRCLTETKKLAQRNIKDNLVDVDDFDFDNAGKTAQQIFEEVLKESKEITEDLVVTHGDYCFPNIIYHDNEISGLVDLSRAGVGDRYQDIALFLRSFKMNIGEPNLDLFLKHYGLIKTLDPKKLAFYRKLDEFF